MRAIHGRHFAAILITAAAAACSDGTGPEERPPDEIRIIPISAAAPPLEAAVIQFYAVRGQGREGRMFFQNPEGGRGEEFLRLAFEDNSIVADENGVPVAQGDSVLITIRAVDPRLFLFEFSPAGIVFNPDSRPELHIRYEEAEGDFDDDGDSDVEDQEIESRLSIWRQETAADPFERIGSAIFEDAEEIEARLDGFTRYAIAY